MELRQLKYFIKTAQTLSFSEAARLLFISQSTLSQQIGQLEAVLGCNLFLRTSHKVQLTEYGERLLPLAQKCIRDADDCLLEVASIKNLMTGTLNIGVTHSFSSILWYTMKDFLSTYKTVKLNVLYTYTDNLINLLRKREIDFALAYKREGTEEEFDSHELFKTQLCAIVPKCHELARRKSVSLGDLKAYPIALPAKGVQGRKLYDQEVLRHPDMNLQVRIELNDANFLCNLVEQGSSLVTILTGLAAANHPNLTAVPIDMPGNELIGCVHVLKDEYVKHSTKEFVSMLRRSPVVMLMK